MGPRLHRIARGLSAVLPCNEVVHFLVPADRAALLDAGRASHDHAIATHNHPFAPATGKFTASIEVENLIWMGKCALTHAFAASSSASSQSSRQGLPIHRVGMIVGSRSVRHQYCSPEWNYCWRLPFLSRHKQMEKELDKDRIKGSATQAKGVIKEAVGKATGDAKLKSEGAADKASGKVQNAVGGMKDAVRDATK